MDFNSQMMSLDGLLPDLAKKELLGAEIHIGHPNLKPGMYFFIELYCTDTKCDCRRVMIKVIDDSLALQATLSYGWESLRFYIDWMYGDVRTAATIPGINLYTEQFQGPSAQGLLAVFRDLMRDPSIPKRYQRHYALFKAALKSSKKTAMPSQGKQARRQKTMKGLRLQDKIALLSAKTPE